MLEELTADSDVIAVVRAQKVQKVLAGQTAEVTAESVYKGNIKTGFSFRIEAKTKSSVSFSVRVFDEGKRYVVFVKKDGDIYKPVNDYSAVIEVDGKKRLRKYFKTGQNQSLKSFDEFSLLARISELTGSKPIKKEAAAVKDADAEKNKVPVNAAKYYQEAIALYKKPTATVKDYLQKGGFGQRPDEKTMDQVQGWVRKNLEAFFSLERAVQQDYLKFDYPSDSEKLKQQILHRNQTLMDIVNGLYIRSHVNAYRGNYSEILKDCYLIYRLGIQFCSGNIVVSEKRTGIEWRKLAVRMLYDLLDIDQIDSSFLKDVQAECVSVFKEDVFNFDGEKQIAEDFVKENGIRFRQQKDEALKFFNKAASSRPIQLKGEINELKLKARKNIFLRPLVDGLLKTAESHHRVHARLAAFIVCTACMDYKNKFGTLPDSIEQLRKKGLLDIKVMDPYAEKEFIYRAASGGFELYSVGADFDDDLGDHNENWGKQAGGDYVFWPVQWHTNESSEDKHN